jgi:hypothetical protein
MATSPIYGWAEPDNTDLVRNGALAIRTLGNAIDTTMATMTPKSIVDAKGDLIAASANDTPARLAVGSNGDTLVADSTASTGLRWSAKPASSNPVINSAFNVWQRGTSISLGASASYLNGFLADRWQTSTSSGQASTITRQATGDTTNLPFIQYALRYQRNAGQTGTALSGFYQSMETVNSIPFVGKTITYSFYARAGANYSPTSSALAARVYSGTGTDQSAFVYTSQASVINTTMTLTTTWQRFTATGTVSTSATELAVGFEWTPTGTAGAADYFEVTGVQIDIGNVALPFRTAGVSYEQELALCQRYYWRWGAQVTGGNPMMIPFGTAQSTTNLVVSVPIKQTMRTTPTLVDYGGTFTLYDGNSAITGGAITLSNASQDYFLLSIAATGLTQYRPYSAYSGGTNAYLGIAAEL